MSDESMSSFLKGLNSTIYILEFYYYLEIWIFDKLFWWGLVNQTIKNFGEGKLMRWATLPPFLGIEE